MGLGATGFGFLMACLGTGPVLASLVLGPTRTRLGPERLVATGGVVFAITMAVAALSHARLLTYAVLVAGGASWMRFVRHRLGLMGLALPALLCAAIVTAAGLLLACPFPLRMSELPELTQAPRDGAIFWRVDRDLGDPARHVERFIVPSWADYLRQRARATLADRQLEARLLPCLADGAAPNVQHYIAERRVAGPPAPASSAVDNARCV